MIYPFRLGPALAVLLSISSTAWGQNPEPSDCVGDVDEFPNCDKVNALIKKCSDLSKQETIDCFCTQELLDAYVGCKGEFRQCTLGKGFDSSLDQEIANWQDACGPYLPDDITTASIAEPTRTLDLDTCQTFAESCAQLSQSITSCSSAYTRPADYTSCRCEKSMVALASYCDIDGPQSCIGTTAVLSDIWEFQNCAAATEVLRTSKDTGPITATDDTAGGGGSTPTGTLEFGAATSTSTSAGYALSCPRVDARISLAILLGVLYFL